MCGCGRGCPRCVRRRGEVSLLGLGEFFSFDLARSDLEDLQSIGQWDSRAWKPVGTGCYSARQLEK